MLLNSRARSSRGTTIAALAPCSILPGTPMDSHSMPLALTAQCKHIVLHTVYSHACVHTYAYSLAWLCTFSSSHARCHLRFRVVQARSDAITFFVRPAASSIAPSNTHVLWSSPTPAMVYTLTSARSVRLASTRALSRPWCGARSPTAFSLGRGTAHSSSGGV